MTMARHRAKSFPLSLAAVASFYFSLSTALLNPSAVSSKWLNQREKSLSLSMVAAGFSLKDCESLDVVLFGVGDLRTDDHGGLKLALENAESNGSKILPLVILDDVSVSSIPGAVAHTVDMAALVAEAIQDLQIGLKKMNLNLHVVIGKKDVGEALTNLLALIPKADIRVHACNLGDADNSLDYGTFSKLENLPNNMQLSSWSCSLREQPWNSVKSLPDLYPDFCKKYSFAPSRPVSSQTTATHNAGIFIEELTQLPSADEISKQMQRTIGLDPKQCPKEQNTGLFATHWGGLDACTVGESSVLETLKTFIETCRENDQEFAELPLECVRNIRSLEHATMAWNMRGDGSKDTMEPNNMIAGERLTRYLAAPLMLGTVSPRRLWHSVKKESPFFASPLKTLVEGQEWHKLFAAKNMRTDLAYQGKGDGVQYRYWRYHGYLCRYAMSPLVEKQEGAQKEGVLLIHGFGASGSQWTKTMRALSDVLDVDSTTEGLAPDLLGFGHSEKPPITYAGYTWEAYIGDFIKEIAVTKYAWDSFIIGGNSIGGFTSMCAGANDATTDGKAVSGSGAPGTGRCTGAVLMNPAGVVQSKQEIEMIEAANTENVMLETVAQVTATDALPPCKPIPRPVARAFGTGLLAYLRPQIQSICKNLYPVNPSAVDADLCVNILRDSLDPGGINIMISGAKLPPPRTYNELLAADFGQGTDLTIADSMFEGPVLMAQGILDPLNDAKGRAEMMGTLRKGITIDPIQAGHCPHDEVPEAIASSISKWMQATRMERKALLVESKAAARVPL
jgi:pimeloyl-ACP methyl ester carboxylesterase